MSLVIIKVDREHSTHSIYSEGIQLYGDSEIMTLLASFSGKYYGRRSLERRKNKNNEEDKHN